MRILQEGRNCWRIARAKRVAFLVDGASYFDALRAAICRARETILVIGWDIGEDAALRGEEQPSSEYQFLELLSSCVENQSDLNVYLLNWDYAVVYVFERKLFPKLNWDVHPRIHFYQDSHHPPMGSHHQKIVAIDDSLAFVGGFDITIGRWDTRRHIPYDPRRLDAKGGIHKPIHDVQIAVEGEPAALLGSLARRRWARATSRPVPVGEGNSPVWPEHIHPHMQDVDVAIARTVPLYENGTEVREVEQLYCDSIRAAKKYIYMENQYFTSNAVTEALEDRLTDVHGPEVVLILHRSYTGIMEYAVMGILRKKVLARLRRADRFGRLGVFYPVQKKQNVPINVHSKIMVVDDDFVRIGSSNVSNRSMGLDTECDVAIEANGHSEHENAIINFRNGLLAEHLGSSREKVAQKLQNSGSILQTIWDLRSDGHTLEPLFDPVSRWVEELIPAVPFCDPDRAIPLPHRFIRWVARPQTLIGIGGFLAFLLIMKKELKR